MKNLKNLNSQLITTFDLTNFSNTNVTFLSEQVNKTKIFMFKIKITTQNKWFSIFLQYLNHKLKIIINIIINLFKINYLL